MIAIADFSDMRRKGAFVPPASALNWVDSVLYGNKGGSFMSKAPMTAEETAARRKELAAQDYLRFVPAFVDFLKQEKGVFSAHTASKYGVTKCHLRLGCLLGLALANGWVEKITFTDRRFPTKTSHSFVCYATVRVPSKAEVQAVVSN